MSLVLLHVLLGSCSLNQCSSFGLSQDGPAPGSSRATLAVVRAHTHTHGVVEALFLGITFVSGDCATDVLSALPRLLFLSLFLSSVFWGGVGAVEGRTQGLLCRHGHSSTVGAALLHSTGKQWRSSRKATQCLSLPPEGEARIPGEAGTGRGKHVEAALSVVPVGC